ncbi:MAG: hypothetical protein ACXAC6_00895 [Candidatus Hodarchaeales archaeon]|jgi:hypothetical protein
MVVSSKIIIGLVILASITGSIFIAPVILNDLLYPSDSDIIINKNLHDDAHRDLVIINKVKIIQNKIIFNISYGGGCQDHEFLLIGTGEYAESYPVQTQILLSHNSNNDTCLAFFTRLITFDLAPLKQHYQNVYNEGSATIVLHIDGGNGGITLNYTF